MFRNCWDPSKMSPGCSSALASRASIGVALHQSRKRYPNILTQERKLSSNHRSLSSSEGSTSPDMDEASQQPRERAQSLQSVNRLKCPCLRWPAQQVQNPNFVSRGFILSCHVKLVQSYFAISSRRPRLNIQSCCIYRP